MKTIPHSSKLIALAGVSLPLAACSAAPAKPVQISETAPYDYNPDALIEAEIKEMEEMGSEMQDEIQRRRR